MKVWHGPATVKVSFPLRPLESIPGRYGKTLSLSQDTCLNNSKIPTVYGIYLNEIILFMYFTRYAIPVWWVFILAFLYLAVLGGILF